MSISQITQESLRQLQESFSKPIEKAWVQPGSPTTGLQQYNLEKVAKRLFPVLTPLRNLIARTGPSFATAVNWKAITGINTTRTHPGIEEGRRGAVIATTVADYSASFKALGQEDSVTFESQYASRRFADIRNVASMNLLDSFFMAEEEVIFGGNNSIALGVPTAPTAVAAANDTGLTSTVTNRVNLLFRVVALTHQGYFYADRTDLTVGVKTTTSRTNQDGTSTTVKYGSSNKSLPSAAITPTAGQKITVTWPDVLGAHAYALYSGLTGAERLLGYYTVNRAVVLADEGAGNQLASAITADNSQDSLVFDGVLTQIQKSGNNGYRVSLNGAKLTPTGAGTCVEIDNALRTFANTYFLSPDVIYVHNQQYEDISNAIMKSTSGANSSLTINLANGTSMTAGHAVQAYVNKFSHGGAKVLEIRKHPNMIPGTILFWTNSLPYKLNGVPSIWEIEERQSYYMIEWPLKSRTYEFGVYCDELLKCYAPFACGVIVNVAPGLN
jgi:hypothetical protein